MRRDVEATSHASRALTNSSMCLLQVAAAAVLSTLALAVAPAAQAAQEAMMVAEVSTMSSHVCHHASVVGGMPGKLRLNEQR